MSVTIYHQLRPQTTLPRSGVHEIAKCYHVVADEEAGNPTTTLFLCSFSPLLGATDPGAQQLLVTAKQQASLFHDQASPFQIDVDFVAQINAPTQGHLTLKWEAKDRWWRKIVMDRFEQIEIRNGDRLYTSRNTPFTPVRIGELISLLQFAEGSAGLLVKKQKQRVEDGVEITCLQVERENVKAKPHEVCVNSASHEILRDEWPEPPDERRKEQYSDYFDFGGHHYPRKLQLLVNGNVVITANVQDLTTTVFDQVLLLPPKGAMTSLQRYETRSAHKDARPDVSTVCESKQTNGRHHCRHDRPD